MKNALLILVLFCYLNVDAQNIMGLYNMRHLPQVVYSNPAFIPLGRLNISVPYLGSTYTQYPITDFKIDPSFLTENTPTDFNSSQLINGLNDTNSVNNFYNVEVLNFGFTAGKNYIFLTINDKMESNFSFPKQMAGFITEVHEDVGFTDPTNLDNVTTNYSNYREYGLGWSRKLNDKISIGARFKLLSGLYTSKSNISGTYINGTGKDEIDGIVDVQVEKVGENNFSSQHNFDTYFNKDLWVWNDNNTGLGYSIDLGVDYRINQKIKVAVSVIDLFATIDWNTQAQSYKITELDSSVNTTPWSEVLNPNTNQLSPIINSTIKNGESTNSENKFPSTIATKALGSITYFVRPKIELTLLGQAEFKKDYFQPYLRIGVQGRFKRFINYMISYSVIDDKENYKNLGLGLVLNINAFQVYGMVDNVLDPYFLNHNHYSGLRFGANFTFGRDYE